MNRFSNTPSIHVFIFLLSFLILFGCQSGSNGTKAAGTPSPYKTTGDLVRCQDCDELLNWIQLMAIIKMESECDENEKMGGGIVGDDDAVPGGGTASDDDYAADDDASAGDDASGESGGNANDDDNQDHSGTNVQEEGVDEADIIKTDGNYLYVLTGGQFIIYDAQNPPETNEISRLAVEGTPLEMFIYQDKVLIFSKIYNDNLQEYLFPGISPDKLSWEILKFTIVDISNKLLPQVQRELYAEGSYQSSRRIDASTRTLVYAMPKDLGLQTYIDPWDNMGQPIPQDELDQMYEQLKAENRQKILSTTIEDWVPLYADVLHMPDGTIQQNNGFLAECFNTFRTSDPRGWGFVSVITILLDDPTTKQADIAITAEGGIVYGSTQSIYLASNQEYDYSWDTMTGREPDVEHVNIHKFDISTDPRVAIYMGSGTVEGYPVNKYSMSEKDGFLRIAVSVGWWGMSGPTNHIFVLQQSGDKLAVVGELRDIKKGEQLYAARFDGNRGYLVTFHQTDPLFTLDLSDPFHPQLVGELEVPGYSTYLHPIDENHVIAIGLSGDGMGTTYGVSLSIFDLSDFANPQLLHRLDIGGWETSSPAQNDPKAFLYYAQKNLLAVPIYTLGDEWSGTISQSYMGVWKIAVESGFNEIGKVDHTNLTPEEGSDLLTGPPYVYRGVVIGDYIFTLSEAALVITSLDPFQDAEEIPVPYKYYADEYPGGDDDVTPGGGGAQSEPGSDQGT